MNLSDKRRILRTLEEKGQSSAFMRLPCAAAAAAVNAFYSAAMHIDMALSDKEGRFLGIERREKLSAAEKYAKREKAVMAKIESAEEIQNRTGFTEKELKKAGTYRPVWMRCVSFALAFAFAFMLLPEVPAAAVPAKTIMVSPNADVGTGVTTIDSAFITGSLMGGYKFNATTLDISTQFSTADKYQIAPGAISGMPYLTVIKLKYTDSVNIDPTAISGIAPDSIILIDAPSETFAGVIKSLINIPEGCTAVYNTGAYTFPAEVTGVTAYGTKGKIALEWNETSGAEGYAVYAISKSSTSVTIKKMDELSNDKVMSPSGKCHAEIKSSESDCYYGVRAYRTVNGIKIYSECFGESAKPVSPFSAINPPKIAPVINNVKVTVTITQSDADGKRPADYYRLFSQDSNETSFHVIKIDGSDILTFDDLTKAFDDPVNFGKVPRSYRAAAYFDPYGDKISDSTYYDKSVDTDRYSVSVSEIKIVEEPKLAAPHDITNKFTGDGDENIMFNWQYDAALPSDVMDKVRFEVFINNASVAKGLTSKTWTMPIAKYVSGEDFTFGVRAYIDDTTKVYSDTCTEEISVNANSVQIVSAAAADAAAVVTWKPYPGATSYTVYFNNGSGEKSIPGITKGTLGFTENTGGTLSYKISGLENGVQYEVWVKANNSSYPSKKKTVTPTNAPSSFTASDVTVTDESDETVEITWKPVSGADGYKVVVKTVSPETEVASETVIGTSYKNTKLSNNVTYMIEITPYKNSPDGVGDPIMGNTVKVYATPKININGNITISTVLDGKAIEVRWTSLPEAASYNLYRKTVSNGTVNAADASANDTAAFDITNAAFNYGEVVYTGSDTKYRDTDIVYGASYVYTVVAVDRNGNNASSGYSSQPRTYTIGATNVSGLYAIGIEGGIEIKWNPVTGADGYILEYTDIQGTSPWQVLYSGPLTSFVHTGLANNTRYQYRVLVYVNIGTGTPRQITSLMMGLVPPTTIGTAGITLRPPMDFKAIAGEGQVTLTWSAVEGADGYMVWVKTASGNYVPLDRVSGTTTVHIGIANGTTLTYAVTAIQYINGVEVYGAYSLDQTVTVGFDLQAPVDVTPVAGDGQVAISWKAVPDADGYVVYMFNKERRTFTAIAVVSPTNYIHTGLVNGSYYTYMVCAYKQIGAETVYGPYSMAVSAVPKSAEQTTGNNNNNNNNNRTDNNANTSDYRIHITGTTPYGMSNSNYIAAFAERGAFDSDVDLRFTLSGETVTRVQSVLQYYGQGLESFMVYPMNIALYVSGTNTPAAVNPGYFVTITIPVPDEMLGLADEITVVHVSDDDKLEILPMTVVDVNGVESIQFTANSFSSPYAFVVYLPDTVYTEDMTAGSAQTAESTEATSTAEVSTLAPMLFTKLPELYRGRAKGKRYRRAVK